MKKILIMILLFSVNLFAEEDSGNLTQTMKDMTSTYSQVAYMTSSIVKKQKSLILDTEEKVNARFEYSKGKMRIEFETKPKTKLIMGEKNFWQISGRDVNIGVIDKKTFPNIFIDIFSKPEVWNDIKIKKLYEKNGRLGVSVDTKEKFSWLNELTLVIDQKRKTIINLKYVDDVQNSVEFDFKRTRFKEKAPKNRFTYKPKKKDSVNRL